MFIHALAAVSRVKDNKLTGDEQRALLHWLLAANARGRYSRGSTETLLNEDLAIIFRGSGVAASDGPREAAVRPAARRAGRPCGTRRQQSAVFAGLPRAQSGWREGLVQRLGSVADAPGQAALHSVAPRDPEVAAQGKGLRDGRDQRDRKHGLHHGPDQSTDQQQGSGWVPRRHRFEAGRRRAAKPMRSGRSGVVDHRAIPGFPSTAPRRVGNTDERVHRGEGGADEPVRLPAARVVSGVRRRCQGGSRCALGPAYRLLLRSPRAGAGGGVGVQARRRAPAAVPGQPLGR